MTLDGASWFVAADVCRALGLLPYNGGFAHHLRKLGADERRPLPDAEYRGVFNGSTPTLTSESGLYKLVLRSDKPQARPFQDWVTRDVLPAIRKDGGGRAHRGAARHGLDTMSLSLRIDAQGGQCRG